MKKFFLAVVALMIAVSTTQVMAQKVDQESFNKKFKSSDADIANAKKNIKAATWLNRAKLHLDAASAPSGNIFSGMDVATMKLTMGNPKKTTWPTINGQKYQVLEYDYIMIYTVNNKIVSWKITRQVKPNALFESIKCYNKAAEIDATQAGKAREGLDLIVNLCNERGRIAPLIHNFKEGADSYMIAYNAQNSKAYGDKVDPSLLYAAGNLYTLDGLKNKASFATGEKALRKAIELGYIDIEAKSTLIADKDKGTTYYYLYHCMIGQEDKLTQERLDELKKLMIEGVTKFPKNVKMLDALLSFCTSSKYNVGSPAEIIPLIDKAIENEPNNADLWFGRGRVYYALKNTDECIKSFSKVTLYNPKNFDAQFYLGHFYAVKGDEYGKTIAAKSYTDQNEYNADIAKLNAMYALAIEPLEKAHALDTKDFPTIEYLKTICFRLRDDEGVMEKYNKYNELFKNANK
ncbi:MAG: tetratricopeptide repeat protein [Rikenellaceae bacterium]